MELQWWSGGKFPLLGIRDLELEAHTFWWNWEIVEIGEFPSLCFFMAGFGLICWDLTFLISFLTSLECKVGDTNICYQVIFVQRCENLGHQVTPSVIINRTQENVARDNGTFVVADTPLPSMGLEEKKGICYHISREFGNNQEAAFFLTVLLVITSIFLSWKDKNAWPGINVPSSITRVLRSLKEPLPPSVFFYWKGAYYVVIISGGLRTNSKHSSNFSRKEDSVAFGKQIAAVLPVEEARDADGKFHFHKLDQGFIQIATCSLVGSRLGIKTIETNPPVP